MSEMNFEREKYISGNDKEITHELKGKALTELTPEQAKQEDKFRKTQLNKFATLIAEEKLFAHTTKSRYFKSVLRQGIFSHKELTTRFDEVDIPVSQGPQKQEESRWDFIADRKPYSNADGTTDMEIDEYKELEPIPKSEIKNASREEYFKRNILAPLARKIDTEGYTEENRKLLNKVEDDFSTMDLISSVPAYMLKKNFLGKENLRVAGRGSGTIFFEAPKVRTHEIWKKGDVGISNKVLTNKFKAIIIGLYNETSRSLKVYENIENEIIEILASLQEKGVILLDSEFKSLPKINDIQVSWDQKFEDWNMAVMNNNIGIIGDAIRQYEESKS